MTPGSNLINKSELNADAALHLENNAFYNAAIHCFYYSCLQRMIKIKEIDLHIPYNPKDRDSHVKILDAVRNELKRKSVQHANDLKLNFNQLKNLRTKSDYRDELIDSTICSKAKRLAIEIGKCLNYV